MKFALTFLGGAGTVTGSKTLVEVDGHRLLVDCGMFQGKGLEDRNWQAPPIDPASIEAVLLTHAHADHCGWLPRLVNAGFKGPVYCTPATQELTHLILLDSAHLQEEEAEFANKKGYSKHKPALPLYTVADAETAAGKLRAVPYGRLYTLFPGVAVRFHDAGHILGSAYVEIAAGGRTLLFSGDIGRHGASILRDPEPRPKADWIVCESTYGDRLHPDSPDRLVKLAEVVQETERKGGMLVIPAFAVERTQELLNDLGILMKAGKIPRLAVYVDSPMAVGATEIFRRHEECFTAEIQARFEHGDHPIDYPEVHLVRSRDESMALNSAKGPAIIISASGMAEGGRVVHHLLHHLPNGKDAIAFVGYQGAGTRGRALVEGAKSVRIFGEEIPVRATVYDLQGYSAHADQKDLIGWIRGTGAPPLHVFLNHGEPPSSLALATAVTQQLQIHPVVAGAGQRYELSS